MAESEALGMPYAAGRGDMRSESPCVRSGHRVRRAFVGLLGVAFTLWFTNSLFHCETSPTGFVYFRDVRVSDGVVSFNPEWTMTIGYVSDYSWRVEGDCLYLRLYMSYFDGGPLLEPFTNPPKRVSIPGGQMYSVNPLGRVSIDAGRPLRQVVVVGEGKKAVLWERGSPPREGPLGPSDLGEDGDGRGRAHE